jgi:hypothetical protein
VAVRARVVPRVRPKDGPRAWLGDVATVLLLPLFALLVLVLLAFGFVLFVGLAS